jgi:hypothetical protein
VTLSVRLLYGENSLAYVWIFQDHLDWQGARSQFALARSSSRRHDAFSLGDMVFSCARHRYKDVVIQNRDPCWLVQHCPERQYVSMEVVEVVQAEPTNYVAPLGSMLCPYAEVFNPSY